MAGQASTHHIEIHDDRVIKRYTSWDLGEPQREWRALTLLAEHAPGLAPCPLRLDPAAEPPTLIMSRLDGAPLRGMTTGEEHTRAMAQAITTFHQAIPTEILLDLPAATWNPAKALAKARAWRAKEPDLGNDFLVAEAYAAGSKWLDSPEPDHLLTTQVPVFGLADGNHANYLWDGHHIRILDFEDSGQSDRAFEIAEVIEHPSRTDGTLDIPSLLTELGLDADEAARLDDFRRLFAYSWMLGLGPDGPFRARNPPGALENQAAHLLDLLG